VAHDPTEQQHGCVPFLEGTQYRSAIFYANDEQKRIAEAYIAQLNRAKAFRKPGGWAPWGLPAAIVTLVAPSTSFYAAEAYHQDFLRRNPNGAYVVVIGYAKPDQLKKQFPDLYTGKYTKSFGL